MTIRTKLAVIFVSLVVLPVMAGTALLFLHVGNVVRDVRFYQLVNIASLQKDRVEGFFADRSGDAEFIKTLTSINGALRAANRPSAGPGDPAYATAVRKAEERLESVQEVYHYSDALLTDAEGRVICTGNPELRPGRIGKPVSSLHPKVFEGGRKGTYFSGIYKAGAGGNGFRMLCAAPVRDRGRFLGLVVLEVDAGSIFEIVKDATGLGDTGETYIGIPNGEEILFINPFHPERNKTIPVSELHAGKIAKPMLAALEGGSGSGEAVDYLGHDVLAAWRPVSGTGWGLVTKIDASEAYAQVTRLKAAALAAGFVFIAFCIAAGGFLARSIVEPVRALQRGAEIIGSGDLGHKVGTDASDEIGQLSRSIDLMAENLKRVTASRDDLDREAAERIKAEEARRRAEEVLRASLRVSEHALHHSLDEVLTKTLDEAESLTGSRIGFFHFVEPDQTTLRLQTWSTNTLASMCTAEGKGAHYPIDKAGVWVDAVVQKAPVIHNDYASLPRRKGLPAGHAPVVRELVAPILRGGQVVGVIGVGNKGGEYDADDAEAVSQLADRAWDIVLAKQAELELDLYRRNLEAMVEARTSDLTAANKELEAFSYSVSHDLRAPLRHVQGFVELLMKNSGDVLDEKGMRYIETISASASRMGNLIDDLLTFSRMGRSEMRKTRVNLRELSGAVIRELSADSADRDVAWKVGDLPDAYGDPSMLRLVLANLLSNALKFTATREHAAVEVGSMAGDGGETVYFVRDNGVGFDMQYVDKLFGVFQRLHRAEEFEGTGIGLANVRRIITRHGGRTWAEGAPGEGATVYFTVPGIGEGERHVRT